ncbi:MAG: SDR family oxidoreductase [bacterium]|nr:SDR family oxidoreductase [bacterium]
MDLGLEGKRALVTGASSGLGYAAAEALATEGADVTILSRDEKRIQAAVETMRAETSGVVSGLAADISNASEISSSLAKVGEIDILVSNTGGPPPGSAENATEEQWLEMAELILFSAINLTKGLLPGMIERKFGRLIYITSIGAVQPINDLIFSNTMRAGLAGYCKTVSNNYARYGITANCICPGYTATERLSHLAEARSASSGKSVEEVQSSFSADVPAARLGRPEEQAALIAFLSGDKGGYITGCSIPVDGGLNRSLI